MEAELQIYLRYSTLVGTHKSATPTENPDAKDSQTGKCPFKDIVRNWQHFYPYFLLVLLGCTYAMGMTSRQYERGYFLTWLVATTVYTSQALTHVIVLLEANTRRGQHESFLQLLEHLDVMLRLRLKLKHNASGGLESALRQIRLALALLSLLGFVTFSVTVAVLRDISYFWYTLLSIVTLRLRIVQLLMYIRILRHYLASVNLKLRQVVAHKTDCRRRMLDIDDEHLNSLQLLASIKQAYSSVSEAFGLLDDFAGWSVAAIVACYFLDLTCNMYWTLLALEGRLTQFTYVVSASSLVPLGVIIGYFCGLCHACKQEAKTTKRLVNRLLASRPIARGGRYNDLVCEFSLQLCHQRIHLAAKHLFDFDLTLIMTFCFSIVTYLIIIVQFWEYDT